MSQGNDEEISRGVVIVNGKLINYTGTFKQKVGMTMTQEYIDVELAKQQHLEQQDKSADALDALADRFEHLTSKGRNNNEKD